MYVHIIFGTKERYPFIHSAIEFELYAFIGGTIKKMNGIPCLINGTADHVHVLSSLPRTKSVSDYLEKIKGESSRWIKTKGAEYEKFAWQNGYGAFSVSSSKLDSVKRYIAGQKEHHRTVTFKEEFVAFLQKYGIEYNEQYLWD
ncbi:MAG: IS200/IS605 family transposase [Planctomycetaceae bacterium]|nr:IS200/IS605 family transposase [Planctomycetaceae bacterium]